MAEAKPENEIEDDQCPVGKIIHKWVRDKQEECLTKVGHDKERFREKVKEALDKLFNAHKIFKLEEGIQSFEYEQPFIQFGYIYKHAMFSARSLSEVMHCSNVLANLAMKNNITVLCLGGGPGTDFLGVLDYFTRYMGDFEGQLDIQLYDRRDKWGQSRVSLQAAIEKLHDLRVTVSFEEEFDATMADKNKPDIQDADPKLKVTVSFKDFDITKADKNKPDVKILKKADVITMHYFMEEVYSEREKEEVVKCFKHIIRKAKTGALFLYSGMFMTQAIDWVQLLLQDKCEVPPPNKDLPIQKRTYEDYNTGESKWIYHTQVDLRQKGDLKLFYDIREDLKTEGISIVEVSQRFEGNVVYRLYKKK